MIRLYGNHWFPLITGLVRLFTLKNVVFFHGNLEGSVTTPRQCHRFFRKYPSLWRGSEPPLFSNKAFLRSYFLVGVGTLTFPKKSTSFQGILQILKLLTSWKINGCKPKSWRVGRWFSCSIAWCLGSMLIFKGVRKIAKEKTNGQIKSSDWRAHVCIFLAAQLCSFFFPLAKRCRVCLSRWKGVFCQDVRWLSMLPHIPSESLSWRDTNKDVLIFNLWPIGSMYGIPTFTININHSWRYICHGPMDGTSR